MITEKIAAKDRPNTLYRYTVSGTWEFPIDMLRHDYAFPDSETESNNISNSGTGTQRSVRLRSHHAPTPGRWESFGWKVVEE